MIDPWGSGICGNDFKSIIFKFIMQNGDLGIGCEIFLRWMPHNLTSAKSSLVKVTALCRQVTGHCRSKCWPRSMSPHALTTTQLINQVTLHIWKCMVSQEGTSLGCFTEYDRIPCSVEICYTKIKPTLRFSRFLHWLRCVILLILQLLVGKYVHLCVQIQSTRARCDPPLHMVVDSVFILTWVYTLCVVKQSTTRFWTCYIKCDNFTCNETTCKLWETFICIRLYFRNWNCLIHNLVYGMVT